MKKSHIQNYIEIKVQKYCIEHPNVLRSKSTKVVIMQIGSCESAILLYDNSTDYGLLIDALICQQHFNYRFKVP